MRVYTVLAAGALLCACATAGNDSGSNGAYVTAEATPAETGEAEATKDAGAQSAKVSDATSSETSKGKDLDKIRCKYMAVTGSRMGRKICYTEREWQAIEDAATETMRDLESRPRGLDETF